MTQIRALAERPGRGAEWNAKIDALLQRDEHVWHTGLTPEEVHALQKNYEQRYDEQTIGAGAGAAPR